MFPLLAGVDHGELVSLAEKHFGNVSLTHEFEIPEFKKCRFTGSEVMILCYVFFSAYLSAVHQFYSFFLCICQQSVPVTFLFG